NQRRRLARFIRAFPFADEFLRRVGACKGRCKRKKYCEQARKCHSHESSPRIVGFRFSKVPLEYFPGFAQGVRLFEDRLSSERSRHTCGTSLESSMLSQNKFNDAL